MELVVFVASLKFFFVEGGEQFIVGIQIGLKQTIQITIAGISLATILFFLLFYSHALISTRWLELALAITLYFFAAIMFKEVLGKEHEEKEFDEKVHKYGYITIVSLSLRKTQLHWRINFHRYISGALIGAAISIGVFIVIAVNSKHILARIPLDKLRLISGILLAITATPLIIYSSGVASPQWLYWIIPPLG